MKLDLVLDSNHHMTGMASPKSPTEKERLSAQVRRWEDAVEWQRSYVDRLQHNPNIPESLIEKERRHLRGLQAQLHEVLEQLRRLK